MTRLQGMTALVTGAAGGIGYASALRFWSEGASVIALDLAAAAAPPQDDGRWLSLAIDGMAPDAPARAREAAAAFGVVDILFNNLGQSGRERAGLFCDSDESTWRFVTEINLMTTLRFSRCFAPGMQRRRRGRVINMASDAALSGDLRLADYAASKMGIIGFTRALAREMAPHGVTVNAVCPGAIRTAAHQRIPAATLSALVAETPAGFIAEPEDVAGLVAYLASPEARFITGQTIAINGGRNMI